MDGVAGIFLLMRTQWLKKALGVLIVCAGLYICVGYTVAFYDPSVELKRGHWIDELLLIGSPMSKFPSGLIGGDERYFISQSEPTGMRYHVLVVTMQKDPENTMQKDHQSLRQCEEWLNKQGFARIPGSASTEVTMKNAAGNRAYLILDPRERRIEIKVQR